MPAIDAAAFLRDLHALRGIGRFRTGVHRPTYSPQDMESRRWLMDRMAECGLDPSIDGVGTVLGRHPAPGPHLLVGSHIETQNEAGWLDGALGVVAGLALARAGLPVDVVAFADEEGISTSASSAAARRSATSPRPRSMPAATATTARPCATPWRRRASPACRACASIPPATAASSSCTSSRGRG